MDYRLNRITPWIHIHAITSLIGMALFVGALFLTPETEILFHAAGLLMSVGTSSGLLSITFLLANPNLLFAIFFQLWAVALPFVVLIFYILFLWRKYTFPYLWEKYAIPYLIVTAIDTLLVLAWLVYFGFEDIGFLIPDIIATIVMATGMAVAYFRSPLA